MESRRIKTDPLTEVVGVVVCVYLYYQQEWQRWKKLVHVWAKKMPFKLKPQRKSWLAELDKPRIARCREQSIFLVILHCLTY